ncbi:MAG: elongation factor 1-beta, partial [Candidatus Bathyarchaeia archaeon]
LSIKVFPSDITMDLKELKSKIEKSLPIEASIYKFEEEPIAFGLVALVAHILIPEKEGANTESIEEFIKSINGVSEVQVISIRRISE